MSIPIEHDDATNARILSVSEDLVEGFQEQPFHAVSYTHLTLPTIYSV